MFSAMNCHLGSSPVGYSVNLWVGRLGCAAGLLKPLSYTSLDHYQLDLGFCNPILDQALKTPYPNPDQPFSMQKLYHSHDLKAIPFTVAHTHVASIYGQGCQQVSEQQVLSIKQPAPTRHAHHSIPCLEQTQQSEQPAQYSEQPVKCAGCRLILTTLYGSAHPPGLGTKPGSRCWVICFSLI